MAQPDLNPRDAPVVLVPQYFGSLAFDRSSQQYLPFDSAATALLRRLADAPLPEVVQAEADLAVRRLILEFYRDYERLGFFTLGGRLAGAFLDIVPPADHLTGPLTAHLAVTERCNLACKHCFAQANGAHQSEQELSLADLDPVLADMAQMGCFRLGITGGEPLLRADLVELIDMALGHGLSPCLTTNGLLITDGLARALGQRRLGWLNVSLDGATPDTHDRIRGPGTFAGVLDRLAILRRHARFSLAFTVMRHNIEELPACVRLARELGAQAAVFRPLYPVGRALACPDLAVPFREYTGALAKLAEAAAGADDEFCSLHPWGPRSRREQHATCYPSFGCGAGNVVCSISAAGAVSPCSFLGEEWWAGDLREDSLAELWHHSEPFRRIRALEGNPRCRECSLFTACGGGCRCRALVWAGSIDAPDPWCMAGENT